MHALKRIATNFYAFSTQPYRWLKKRSLSKQNSLPIPVLFYHRVSDVHQNPWTIPTEQFIQQMDWLRKRFEIISLEEVKNRIRNGNSQPAVAITFDDGYADNCLTAIPYLVKNQIPATYFVSVDFVLNDKPFPHDVQAGQPLSPNGIESLRLISRAGIEIGAHTRTHIDLGKVTDGEKLFDEVVSAKQELESFLEQKIRHFAFPFGQVENLNEEVFELAKKHGFTTVSSAFGGYNAIGSDGFHLQRIHGDPEIARFRNWITFDPRMLRVKGYSAPDVSTIEPLKESEMTLETRPVPHEV